MPRLAFFASGRRVLAGALLVTLAAGCAGMAPPSATPASATQTCPPASALASQRTYKDAIAIGGRLALRYEQRGQPQALDGKFSWVQSASMTHITLETPFGQTLAIIKVTPDMSTLIQNGQAPRTEADVDTLVAGTLGWPLPLAGLRDWLQGFAQSAQGMRYVATADASGDAAYVKTKDGWLIHYPAWEDSGDTDGTRPKRIDLQRLTSQAGMVQLHIVIDQWQPR